MRPGDPYPVDFLYFCDVVLLVAGVALWIESLLLVSMQMVAITLTQTLWVIDLLCRLVAGVRVTGVAAYMRDPAIPVSFRGLSSVHGWMPFVLVWLLSLFGYDRRALPWDLPSQSLG